MSRITHYPSQLEYYHGADGHKLHVQVWRPNTAPRSRAVFLHGISSHAGWYGRGNTCLAAAGVEVHFLDRRGSGGDQECRGDVDGWRTWIEDVAVYLRQLITQHSPPPILCGISWGGKLATAVACRHAELIAGLGLICPGLYSPFEPNFIKRLALRAPVPKSMQRRRLAIPLRDPALFTDTPAWQTYIADDPQTLREITWRFAREDRALTRYARQAAPLLSMPLLLMLAGRDRIIDNQRVRQFFDVAPSDNKTLIEYSQAAHTLEFEPDPKQYFADLAGWLYQLSSRLGAGEGDDHA
jgi:alpha-beta hydrolase superfamily lysophospholipase